MVNDMLFGGITIFLIVTIVGLLREMIRLKRKINEQYNAIIKMMSEER